MISRVTRVEPRRRARTPLPGLPWDLPHANRWTSSEKVGDDTSHDSAGRQSNLLTSGDALSFDWLDQLTREALQSSADETTAG